jgi:glycosyltransferase involved in cell wall biosynthesis
VVPSPYQRDLFHALAKRPEIALDVYYLESASPDSPWPEKPVESYEHILPGFWIGAGGARLHVNWKLPALRNYDIVVMNTLISFTAQWLMRFRLKNKPWFFWGERLRPRQAGWRQRVRDFISAPLRRATGIAAIGNRAEKDYRENFPGPAHFSIPYYCDLQPFISESRPAHKPDEIVFLFCGQMIERKGVDLLVAAFERIVATHANARLLLVGREAELPRFLTNAGAETRARITYAGFQPPETLPRFFAQADVFVLPSRYEGWGVVVNQALGAGLPVIYSDAVGAGYDLVEDEINGLKFENGNIDALADKMRRFVTDREFSAKLGKTSKQKSREWLPEAGAEKWIKIFQSTKIQ